MKMWHHRVAQTLGCVGKWVEQGHDLEPLEHTKRSPGILDASGEQERCQDEREHQANLLWSHECSNGQAEGCTGERGQNHYDHDNAYRIGAYLKLTTEDEVGKWEDDRASYETTHGGENDLFNGDETYGQWS